MYGSAPPGSSVIGKVQCSRQKRVKQWRHQGGYKQRARCVLYRQANSVIMPSISITSVTCAHMQNCKRASPTIFLLSWSFVKEFAVSSYRWSYAQLCMLTQDKSTKLWETWHILRDRIGDGLVKSLNQGLWPISLHLISKRVEEILTQNTNIMRIVYPDLMMKILSGYTL